MNGQHDDFGVDISAQFCVLLQGHRCPACSYPSTPHRRVRGTIYGIFPTARLTGNFNTFNIFKNASYPARTSSWSSTRRLIKWKCLQNRDNATE
jgi:hypothetical protein